MHEVKDRLAPAVLAKVPMLRDHDRQGTVDEGHVADGPVAGGVAAFDPVEGRKPLTDALDLPLVGAKLGLRRTARDPLEEDVDHVRIPSGQHGDGPSGARFEQEPASDADREANGLPQARGIFALSRVRQCGNMEALRAALASSLSQHACSGPRVEKVTLSRRRMRQGLEYCS